MAFIRKVKTGSGATAIQIAHKLYGRIVKIEHLGSAHSDDEQKLLIDIARKRLLGNQQSLFKDYPSAVKIGLKQTVSALLFQLLSSQYNHLGFSKLNDDIFADLVLARLVEPTSKLDSLRILTELGITGFGKDQLYRCLQQIIHKDYRHTITDCCFAYAQPFGLSLVLYDVTTLYFEIQKEDDYRKSGLSKERRLEPQIIIGLLVNQSGFPLQLQSFEGNKAEAKTILPVIEEFKRQHQLPNITVVADAGMLSSGNLTALEDAGYSYIVGSRLNKIPYDIAQYQQRSKLLDHQIITSAISQSKRIIYQYRAKRAQLDLRNIEKAKSKAERVISGQIRTKRSRFVSVKESRLQLNQKLIDKAQALIGIKGYVTNLAVPDEQVINYYHQLWHVEQSFRMSKSDLKARPIFHHKQDSIEAHLTIVLAALAVAKLVEDKTGMSIKRFIQTLRPIRSGIVTLNGKEYPAEAELSTEVKNIVRKLQPGY